MDKYAHRLPTDPEYGYELAALTRADGDGISDRASPAMAATTAMSLRELDRRVGTPDGPQASATWGCVHWTVESELRAAGVYNAVSAELSVQDRSTPGHFAAMTEIDSVGITREIDATTYVALLEGAQAFARMCREVLDNPALTPCQVCVNHPLTCPTHGAENAKVATIHESRHSLDDLAFFVNGVTLDERISGDRVSMCPGSTRGGKTARSMEAYEAWKAVAKKHGGLVMVPYGDRRLAFAGSPLMEQASNDEWLGWAHTGITYNPHDCRGGQFGVVWLIGDVPKDAADSAILTARKGPCVVLRSDTWDGPLTSWEGRETTPRMITLREAKYGADRPIQVGDWVRAERTEAWAVMCVPGSVDSPVEGEAMETRAGGVKIGRWWLPRETVTLIRSKDSPDGPGEAVGSSTTA